MSTCSFFYKIGLDDLDFMQHVGHTQWLLLLEKARTDFMEAIAYPVTELLAEGYGVVVSRVNVVYKRPALVGDRVKVTVTCGRHRSASITAQYRAYRDGEAIPLVEAEIGLVFVGRNGRPTRIPERINSHLQEPPRHD